MHGVKRTKNDSSKFKEDSIDPSVLKEQRERLEEYRLLNQTLLERNFNKQFSEPDSLLLSTALLKLNPDHTTAWSFRRRCLNSLSSTTPTDEYLTKTLRSELEVTIKSFEKNPKAYPIWEHRKWVLNQFTDPNDWEAELKLVERFLKLDCRNFHAWDYRRHVILNLKALKPDQSAQIDQKELKFTSNQIESNFSNFSAWHYRSKLLEPKLNENENENKSDNEELSQTILRDELEWVKNALWIDPNDQSAWLYHRWLMSKTKSEEIRSSEIKSIEDLLKVESDSKWALSALLQLRSNKNSRSDSNGDSSGYSDGEILEKLKSLDPLRSNRYLDLFKKSNKQ